MVTQICDGVYSEFVTKVFPSMSVLVYMSFPSLLPRVETHVSLFCVPKWWIQILRIITSLCNRSRFVVLSHGCETCRRYWNEETTMLCIVEARFLFYSFRDVSVIFPSRPKYSLDDISVPFEPGGFLLRCFTRLSGFNVGRLCNVTTLVEIGMKVLYICIFFSVCLPSIH